MSGAGKSSINKENLTRRVSLQNNMDARSEPKSRKEFRSISISSPCDVPSPSTLRRVSGASDNNAYVKSSVRLENELKKPQGKQAPWLLGEEAALKSGIPLDYIQAMIPVLRDYRTCAMFRPVNPHATGLLKEGRACKSLKIHGKSSNWGPMAGFIPVNQDLSKKYGNPFEVEQGNQDNRRSLRNNDAIKKHLEITPSRVQYLKEKGLASPPIVVREICLESMKTKNQIATDFVAEHEKLFRLEVARKGQSTPYKFYLKKTEKGNYKVYFIDSRDPKLRVQPLEVMADPKTGIPLTADLDVFAFLEHISLVGISVEKSRAVFEKRREDFEKKSAAFGAMAGSKPASQRHRLRRYRSPTAPFSPSARRKSNNSSPVASPNTSSASLSSTREAKESSEARRKRSSIHFEDVTNALIRLYIHRKTDGAGSTSTEFQDCLTKSLNEAFRAAGYTGGELIKHGTEQDNIHCPEQDVNIFFITPDGLMGQTKTWEQVQWVVRSMQSENYIFYKNRAYNTEKSKISWNPATAKLPDTIAE